MFSLPKQSLLLPMILCTALHTQCSEFYSIDRPKRTITINIDEIPQKDSSPLYELGKILLPIAGGALINYAIQKYNEDPEISTINKELKKIELQTQNHPDYPAIVRLNKRNEAEEQMLKNREKEVELSITKANIIKHHQDEWARFRTCDAPFTKDFCDHMIKLHKQELDKFTS
jgi:hypothetical protein